MMRRLVVVGALASACGDDAPAQPGESSGTDSTGSDVGDEDDTSGSSSTTLDPGTESSSGMMVDTSSEGSSSSTSGGEELTRVEQVLADLHTSMYECPDRVWPDIATNYRSRQVLLSSVTENTAWLWNDQVAEGDPPIVTTGPLDALAPEWTATFNVGSIQGVPTLGISLDLTAEYNESFEGTLYRDFASILIFHEAFHFLSDQNDWNVAPGSRSTAYPEPWEPRYVRAELTRALRASLEDDTGLGAAAYWQSRWLAEYPAERTAIRPYDVTEGSAEYASIVSSVLAVEGCNALEDVVISEATLHLDDPFQGTDYSAGREPYDLGVLAGLLLREAQVDGWELAQENGQPPAEQLLDDVTPEPQPDDAALQATVQTAVAERNVQVGMEIDPMLEAMQSPESYRMVVDFSWIAGSFGVGGFYYLPDEPGTPDVFLTFSALMSLPSGVAIDIVGETSLVGVSTPCALASGSTIVLTLPVADVEVTDGLATSTATATFSDLAVETADVDGLVWLCPVDAGGADAPLPEPEEAAEARRPAPHVVRITDSRIIAVP